MAGALLDPQRIVAADGQPGDAGRAQIVEGEGTVRLAALEELGARDARRGERALEPAGNVARRRHVGEHAAFTARVGVELLEQRHQRRLDRQAAGVLALGRLLGAGLAILGAVDVEDAVLEIDVVPSEHTKLAGARVGVHRERDEAPPGQRDRVAAAELEHLARVEKLLGAVRAAVGALHVA